MSQIKFPKKILEIINEEALSDIFSRETKTVNKEQLLNSNSQECN